MKQDGIHINVARVIPLPNYCNRPIYLHFCSIFVGWQKSHARVVLEEMKQAFPGPLYKVEAMEWESSGKPFK